MIMCTLLDNDKEWSIEYGYYPNEIQREAEIIETENKLTENLSAEEKETLLLKLEDLKQIKQEELATMVDGFLLVTKLLTNFFEDLKLN